MYDTMRYHESIGKAATRLRSLETAAVVQLDAERALNSYPHELSGGMRQRVLLAMGLLLQSAGAHPRRADDGAGHLDATVNHQPPAHSQGSDRLFSTIFISHDLSLAAELADRVATMYAGQVVELGEVRDMFYRPRHPYTLACSRPCLH